MLPNRFLLLTIVLNALPLYGVFVLGWRSFDLVFLYWLENLMIGMFVILRILIRPYKSLPDLLIRLFTCAFFTLHYGLFCTVHGLFVFDIFADNDTSLHGLFAVYQHIWPVLQHSWLLAAALALAGLQLAGWVRDSQLSGFGQDNIGKLALSPYLRIIILHLTIIGAGLALLALDEPVTGLIMLIVLKTVFDIVIAVKTQPAKPAV